MAETIDDSIIPRTIISTRTKFLLTVLGLLAFALSLFLLVPTNNANFPPWVPELQQRIKVALSVPAPFAFVGLLGGIVGLAELTATFQTYPREALRTRWAWILIVVNMLAAVVALIIVQATMPTVNIVLQVLGVGVGFQAIIRTKFVLARPIGGASSGKDNGEISVNLGWLYDQFQNLCRTQIDLELMNNRRTAVTRLIKYYPTLAALYDIAWYTINARATLTAEEEANRLAELEKLIDPKAPEFFAKTSIALLILENGGQAYVELLLNQAAQAQTSLEAVTVPNNTKHLVYYLVENYSLAQLVNLSESITENAEIRKWVTDAAKPVPETNESHQKAAIAHFLVQQIGVEPVQHAVQAQIDK